ncbi:pentatricopeptide repeat-containing protein [Nicotiana attenuata]|uniref:Pentatricopeptide repeat-containing protein n=1 Tax=Nicotiana attenuata TaxID=49451 RepID=A0A1J6JQB6_NICAT|nr:pentatricopeptide repeat-containing protein [Nicotiana attenuata]
MKLRIFDEMDVSNVISWIAVISGLSQNEFCEESLDLFVKMQGAVVVPNYLTYLSALLACSGIKALVEARQNPGIVWKSRFHSDLYIESALMDMYSKCDILTCIDGLNIEIVELCLVSNAVIVE